MEDYEVIDRLLGFSLEPGDLIKYDDQAVVVETVDAVDGGYNIYFIDPYDDEENYIFIQDDEFVDLLG